MKMKMLVAGAALAVASATVAAPVVVANKTYNVTGQIAVSATGTCYGHTVNAGGKSKTPISATIAIGSSDQTAGTFVWSNDTLMTAGATADGSIVERKGNHMNLGFVLAPDQAPGSVLFTLAGVPDTNTKDASVAFGNYKFFADVKKAKVDGVSTSRIKITESVTTIANMTGVPCKYRWTVKRVMTGFEVPAV